MYMLKFINSSIMSLNNSKFFSGLVMIMLNIGSKYITIKLSKNQEEYLKNSLGRIFLLFAITWMGTRDIYMAIVLTSSFIIMTQYLFNEHSSLCIIPDKYKQFNDVLDKNKDNQVSEQEVAEAVRVLEKARRRDQKRMQLQMLNTFR